MNWKSILKTERKKILRKKAKEVDIVLKNLIPWGRLYKTLITIRIVIKW
jgi:hypothetical protein